MEAWKRSVADVYQRGEGTNSSAGREGCGKSDVRILVGERGVNDLGPVVRGVFRRVPAMQLRERAVHGF